LARRSTLRLDRMMSLPLDVPLLLASHYYVVWTAGDSSGEEELAFVSSRRRITINGKGLQAVCQRLLPLLDGTRTANELMDGASTGFSPEELKQCITFLASHNLLTPERRMRPTRQPSNDRLVPQLSFFQELDISPEEAQRSLREATVAVLGLGGAGAYAALALAACRVGRVHCVDDGVVNEADLYLAPVLAGAEIGRSRAAAAQQRLKQLQADITVSASNDDLAADQSVQAAISGCDFVICSVDKGRSGTLYKVNRACLREGIPWTSCSLEGIEAVLGPTVLPGSTACYLCYKMRAIACSDRPRTELSFERMLETRNHDDSVRRENLTFAAGLLGNLAALEAFKVLTGVGACAAAGGIVVLDLVRGGWQNHTVLRKPWCPSCFPGVATSGNGERTL
jgi:molybdopterin-synthase adenylyltransferase